MLFETALKRVVNGNEKLKYICFLAHNNKRTSEREGGGGGHDMKM